MRQDIFEAADDGPQRDDERDDEPSSAPAGSAAGERSEVDNLGDGDPIEPDQATAGHPDGGVQEGTAGPNARPRHNHPGATPRDLD